MFNTTLFMSVGLSERQSYYAIKYVAKRMCPGTSAEWWDEVGFEVTQRDSLNGPNEHFTTALNKLWWALCTVESYRKKVDGLTVGKRETITVDDVKRGRGQWGMTGKTAYELRLKLMAYVEAQV